MSSNSAKGYNYYAVNKGRKIGIFDNWEATDKQVTGFSGSCYKGFKSEKAAIDYLKRQGISQPEKIYTGQKQTTFSSTGITTTTTTTPTTTSRSPANLRSKDTQSRSMTLTKDAGTGPGISSNPVKKDAATGGNMSKNTTSNGTTVPADWASLMEDGDSCMTPSCGSCKQMITIVQAMSVQLASLTSEVSRLNAKVDQLSQKPNSHQSWRDAVLSPSPLIQSPRQQQQQHSQQPGNQQQNQQSQQSPSYQPPPPQSNQDPTSNTSTKPPSPQPPKPQKSPRPTDPVFMPEKCIIIHSKNKNFSEINQDDVRKAIGSISGKPIMIDMINRHKFRTSDPKFIIQLAKSSNRDGLIKAWNESDKDLLGGSTARLPIKPNNNIAMLRGVPTSIPDDELIEGIQKNYGDISSLYRLQTKAGNYLRTVKVTFKNPHQLENALRDGITLHQHNLILRAEKLLTNNG